MSSRRRVALVRALIKRPSLLVLDGIAGTDTPADAALRQSVRDELPEATILYAALEEGAVKEADIVARIAENGLVRCERRAGQDDAAPPERTRRSAR